MPNAHVKQSYTGSQTEEAPERRKNRFISGTEHGVDALSVCLLHSLMHLTERRCEERKCFEYFNERAFE